MLEQFKKAKFFLWVNKIISNNFFHFLKIRDFRKQPADVTVISPSIVFTPDLSHYTIDENSYWKYFTNLTLNPLFWIEIKNATIVSKGIVLDSKNRVILESTIFQKEYLDNLFSNHFVKFPGIFSSMKEEKVISLMNRLDNNYFHWTLESITRLILVYEKPFFQDYKIVVKDNPQPFVKASLKFFFNIQESNIIQKKLSKNIKANTALVISFPHIRDQTTQWTNVYRPEIIQKLNTLAHTRLKALGIDKDKFPKNIMISRKKAISRRILNEDELLTALKEHHFKPVYLEDYSFIEQVSIFANAEKIIATHGAGITNIVYCRKAMVVELFPSGRNIRDAYYFAQISSALKLPHHLLFYETVNDKEDIHLAHEMLERIKGIIGSFKNA